VEVASTTPARMFGLFPKKGTIAPGSDADIVIYDPRGTTDIGVKTHHMNMDHSAYEGIHVDGRVETVLSRGRVIVENSVFTGAVGHGRYLRRGLSQYLI
jgi:dihydropyrimidinase